MKRTRRGVPRGPALAVLALLALLAAAPARAANIDLVVMVDTSESMFPYFDDVMNYLVHTLLTQKLHRGDTFHLLTFASVPERELALEVNSDKAAEQAFGRLMLLHALGRHTDLVAALRYLATYASELPEANPKQILLVTDGIHDPPPGSASPGSPDAVAQAVADTAKTLSRPGWTFNILRVPPEPVAGDKGQRSYLPEIASALGTTVVPWKASDKQSTTGRTTGFPDLLFPGPLGRVGTTFDAPFRVRNWRDEPILVRLAAVQSDGVDILARRVEVKVDAMGEAAFTVPLRLPASYPQGPREATVQLVFDDDPRISPTTGTLSFEFTGRGGWTRHTLIYVVPILVGLAAIAAVVLLFRYVRSKVGDHTMTGLVRRRVLGEGDEPEAAVAARAAAPAPSSGRQGRVPLQAAGRPHAARPGLISLDAIEARERERASARRVRPTAASVRRALPREQMRQASLPPLVEMRVAGQNRRVGMRNIHRISPGGSRSVGGGFSSYIVFLVRVPGAIGRLANVDGRYVFTPLRHDMFSAVPGPVEDCLGAGIPFTAPNGRQYTLTFDRWVSPLEEINRILGQTRARD